MATLTATDTAPAPSAAERRQARAAVAFNEGADARLAGLPLEANPYPEGDPLAPAWRHGWRDVAVNWGRDAAWAFPDLPAVRRGCGT